MNMKTITTAELLDILPHRYPFLMIDRVSDYDETNLTIHLLCLLSLN